MVDKLESRVYVYADSALDVDNNKLILQVVQGRLTKEGDVRVATASELRGDKLDFDILLLGRTWIRFIAGGGEVVLQGGVVYPGYNVSVGGRSDAIPLGNVASTEEGEVLKIAKGKRVAMVGMWTRLESGTVLSVRH